MNENREHTWCDRCKEEFPIVPKEGPEKDRPGLGYFRMGLLYSLSKVPKKFRRHFNGGTSNYACGNCVLDLMDE